VVMTGTVKEGRGISELTKSSRRIPIILPRMQVRREFTKHLVESSDPVTGAPRVFGPALQQSDGAGIPSHPLRLGAPRFATSRAG
jgi:hypothetical protein